MEDTSFEMAVTVALPVKFANYEYMPLTCRDVNLSISGEKTTFWVVLVLNTKQTSVVSYCW